MKRVAALFVAIFLCDVTLGFSVLEKYEDLDSNIQDYILYHQEESYKSALENQNIVKREEPWSNSLFRRVRQAQTQEVQCCVKEKKDMDNKAITSFLGCLNETTTADDQNPSQQNMSNRFMCVAECIAKKYDVVDDDGNMVEDKTLQVAKDTNSDLLDQGEDPIKRCVAFGNRFSKIYGKVTYAGESCNQATFLFVGCMKMMSEINCPDDNKVKSPECDDRREKTKNALEILNI